MHPIRGEGGMCSRFRTSLLAPILGMALFWPSADAAGAAWRSLQPEVDIATQQIEVSGRTLTYYLLTPSEPTVVAVRGPRRVKIISRYLFSPDDPAPIDYRIRVLVDGNEVLRKSFDATVAAAASVVNSTGTAVGALRRCYVDVGTGAHTLQVFAEPSGSGRVVARFFRESKRQQTVTVPFAPEEYDTVYQLQFASGSQSVYYHFNATTPLRFTVHGPTTLKIHTRLDFDHTMNGSQSYALEVLCDGELHRSYHYHTGKLSTAVYVERPDILPGSRKTMRIAVPKGTHHFEIRCLRPEHCGVAAQIRLPRGDINVGLN